MHGVFRSLLEDERLLYRLKHLGGRTTHVVFERPELVEKSPRWCLRPDSTSSATTGSSVPASERDRIVPGAPRQSWRTTR